MTLWNHLVPSQRKPTHPFTLQRHSETRHNTNRHRVHPKNAKHDIPGQRLVSGQQLPGKIGAIDPSGQLVALQESRSHPTKLSFKLSQLEMVGLQGRKLIWGGGGMGLASNSVTISFITRFLPPLAPGWALSTIGFIVTERQRLIELS